MERDAADTMHLPVYVLTIMFFTVVHTAVAAMAAYYSMNLPVLDPFWLYIVLAVACVAVSVFGAWIAYRFDHPITSMIGGFICAAPLGVVIGPGMKYYELESIIQALVIAGLIVVLTGLIGVWFKDVSGWGAPLLAGLTTLIVVYMVAPVAVPALGIKEEFAATGLDFISIVLFMFITIYDMNQAKHLDWTCDNAIKSSIHIFLDLANLFLHLLSAIGEGIGDFLDNLDLNPFSD